MSDASQGPGWWIASDGKWYPPDLHPDRTQPGPPSDPATGPPPTGEVVAAPDGPIVPGTSGGRGRVWLAVAAVVAVVGIGIGVVAATGGDDDELLRPADPSDTTTTTADAGEPGEETTTTVEPDEPDATAPPPTAAPPATGSPSCRFLEVDGFGDVQIELEFSNPVDGPGPLQVTSVLQHEGVRIATTTTYVEWSLPGERFRMQADTLESLPPGVDGTAVSCDVLDVAEGFGFAELQAPAEPSGCVFLEVDGFGDVQVELTLTSPFAERTNTRSIVALRGPDDVRFGETSAFADLVGPGETVRSSEDTLAALPDWVGGPEGFSCEILGVEATEY
jgi:hypothetical protein